MSTVEDFSRELENKLTAVMSVTPAVKEKLKSRGKMLARDRLSHLCDPDPGSVLELSSLAADGLYDGRFPGAGLVTAIAKVCGIWCAVIINEGSTMGGTWTGISCEKLLDQMLVGGCQDGFREFMPSVGTSLLVGFGQLVDGGGHLAFMFGCKDEFSVFVVVAVVIVAVVVVVVVIVAVVVVVVVVVVFVVVVVVVVFVFVVVAAAAAAVVVVVVVVVVVAAVAVVVVVVVAAVAVVVAVVE
ncbi:hypothetical protein Pmar_PMAR024359 [Perkinsus marinus ATCC 50983]|uniref:ABC transmembrane type-1 domain-containing protein n=1 Tax=Perkinsus marinus (strain ATCC 50983 / TXsc) TaxID=423536 RepID=C5LMM1_PERM5|nr:hypothetical protein Pmar_PMAR024359 [Perkinsus marinus ATCC 50983]EER02038.1 hypothetical protein Pmar_PMAR024359 [Perkinsus marinus ATCC 50983]|eukprot:XP_002769320.1 hypothetical protein Pmar_PMAR024359 [Perkinsus marinus ATCC 50983]